MSFRESNYPVGIAKIPAQIRQENHPENPPAFPKNDGLFPCFSKISQKFQ